MLRSLRTRLLGLWALSLLACVAVGFLLIQLYQQSTAAQIGRAEAVVARACDLIRDRYGFYAAGWSGLGASQPDDRLRTDLATAVGLALAHQSGIEGGIGGGIEGGIGGGIGGGIEGGIWQADAGPLAYAFPTYEGTGPKTDLPAAERDQIQAINQQAARDEQAVDRRAASGPQTLLLHACPLNGPVAGLTGWTMTRISRATALTGRSAGSSTRGPSGRMRGIWCRSQRRRCRPIIGRRRRTVPMRRRVAEICKTDARLRPDRNGRNR